MNKVTGMNKPVDSTQSFAQNRIAQINSIAKKSADAKTAQDEAAKANSFGGIASETIKGVGNDLISSEKGVGESLGQSAASTDVNKNVTESNSQLKDMQIKVLHQIAQDKSAGKDTTHLENAYNSITQHAGTDAKDILPAVNKSNLQAVLETAGVGADILSAGTYGAATKGANLSKLSTPELTTAIKGMLPGLQHGMAADIAERAASAAKKGQPIEQFVKDELAKVPKGSLQTGLNGEAKAGMETGKMTEAAPTAVTAVKNVADKVVPTIKDAAQNIEKRVSESAAQSQAESAVKSNAKNEENLLSTITPSSKEIPEKEFKSLVSQGRISPKTTFNPAQYILSDQQKSIALKYKDVLAKDPITTSKNIGNKIASLDGKVGDFLDTNNAIYNKGELKNHLRSALEPINDIMVPGERLQKAKEDIINNFVTSLQKGDMKSLWQARKSYDGKIESAFSGAPTLQKEMKTGLRNAVQDFIAQRTPEGEYKAYMHDMSGLFDIRDLANIKAAKGRGLDQLAEWAKQNPRTAKILGFGTAALVGTSLLHGASDIVHAP